MGYVAIALFKHDTSGPEKPFLLVPMLVLLEEGFRSQFAPAVIPCAYGLPKRNPALFTMQGLWKSPLLKGDHVGVQREGGSRHPARALSAATMPSHFHLPLQ